MKKSHTPRHQPPVSTSSFSALPYWILSYRILSCIILQSSPPLTAVTAGIAVIAVAVAVLVLVSVLVWLCFSGAKGYQTPRIQSHLHVAELAHAMAVVFAVSMWTSGQGWASKNGQVIAMKVVKAVSAETAFARQSQFTSEFAWPSMPPNSGMLA